MTIWQSFVVDSHFFSLVPFRLTRPTNIWPLIIEILFGSRIVGFLVKRCQELLEFHKVPSQKFYAVFEVLPRGYVSIDWKRSHQSMTMSFSVSWGEQVSLSVRDQGEDDIRRIGLCVAVDRVRRRLVAAGYRSRHSDRCPRLTTDFRQCHCMLAHRHHTGTIRTGLIWYLLMGPGSV